VPRVDTTALIERIKEFPLSEIIGRYITLQPKGPNHLGLCPFHHDHHPSLSVNDSKGVFKCFVCDVGGNAITFVQRLKNLSFLDTLQEICRLLNIDYQEYVTKTKLSPKMALAYKVLAKAGQIYFRLGQSGEPKFKKFIEERQLDAATVEKFGLGYSSGHQVLANYLLSIKDEKERMAALEVATEIGLIYPAAAAPTKTPTASSANVWTDNFRERIMFPIMDRQGRIIAFGGRATQAYQKAKYKNSRESMVFNKKATLYALHLAKTEIRRRDQVIIVEGYMDAISLHQAGFTNTIAVMGTALNENTIRYLKNLTTHFILALDSDAAGMAAMTRINQLCLAENILPLYLSYAPAKDADEFLRQQGAVELQSRLNSARPFIDLQLEKLLPPQRLATTDQKLAVLQKLFRVVAPLKDTLAATERLINLAVRLGLKSDPAAITTAYTHFLSGQRKPSVTASATALKQALESPAAATERPSEAAERSDPSTALAMPPISKTEQAVIRSLLLHPSCFARQNIEDLLDFIEHPEVKKYLTAIKQMALELDQRDYERYLQQAVSDAEWPLAVREATGAALYHLGQEPLKDELIDRLLGDLKKQLRGETLKHTRQELKLRQQTCASEEELNQVLSALVKVDQELQALKI